MNDTTITYEKVREDATVIADCSGTMNELFDQFIGLIDTVGQSDIFAGVGCEALLEKFAKLKTRLSSYTDLVKEFSDMILIAADKTQETENEIKEAALDLPDVK